MVPGVEVFVATNVLVGGIGVLVFVGVLVAAKSVCVGVGVDVGPVKTVPPPKLSSTALPALMNQTPIYPPLEVYVHALASRVANNIPFLYTSTVPSARARAPNWSPLVRVAGISAPRCTQFCAEEYVHTWMRWLATS